MLDLVAEGDRRIRTNNKEDTGLDALSLSSTNQCNPLNLKMVRKKGLEPSRYCYRQPLKLVRLPIPPLPRMRVD